MYDPASPSVRPIQYASRCVPFMSKEAIACTAPPHRDVAKKFGILKKEETSCDGSLEDVLAERAAVLV